MQITFDFYATLAVMVAVLIIGSFIIKRVQFLRDYNIPQPVVGGIIAAILFLILYAFFDIELKFDGSLKDPLMLAFFSSIGLLADFSSLKKGGSKLIVFLVVVCVLLFLQNFLGIAVAMGLGENGLMGLLAGSITMSGGHGTGAAWAGEFIKAPYSYLPANEIAIAAATFGLIAGGIIGGPVARHLIKKHNLKLPDNAANIVATEIASKQNVSDDKTAAIALASESRHAAHTTSQAILQFEDPHKEKLITQYSFVQSLALIAVCLLVGHYLEGFMKALNVGFTLPTFVYCLFTGIVLRNALQGLNIHQVFDREVSVIGNVGLSLFLAYAMMTINLWQLISLALPLATILIVQVALMVFYAVYVTFRFCGKDYDAAVLAAGHCGFGLGATPTAMVNMQTITNHYGMSHMAFIIVPLCGAFFIDIVNALVINGFLSLFG